MIERKHWQNTIRHALSRSRIVALVGPRQAGKTTLARQMAAEQNGVVFDLENPLDLARLSAPLLALEGLKGLIVLDEIQQQPDLLPLLRVLADRTPLPAKFLILGSASPELIQGASESLAGRVEFIDVAGFDLQETGAAGKNSLWVRGGFPLSWLASNDTDSLAWRQGFIRTFLERDLGRFGIGIPPEAMRRLWHMLAHYHGGVWNAAEFGRALGISTQSAKRHLDVLAGTFMVRILPPWFENLGKRLVRHPKVYVRDSGLLHALLGLTSLNDILAHPKCGASWEGFCIEQILAAAGDHQAYFWGTHAGAELDLLLVRGAKRIGFEFKHTDAPRSTKSMHVAINDLKLDALHVIYPGSDEYPMAEKLFATPLAQVVAQLRPPTP